VNRKVLLVLVGVVIVAPLDCWIRHTQFASAAPHAARAAAADFAGELRPGSRVEATAVVERVLPDDTSGSRHQRFIVRLPSEQTLLIAHNIDIAPRIEGIARGDTLSFSGIYESNDKGGVVHWTHHDPSGRHAPGWIEYRGHRYQ
jgi:hypothetical protein